jgi:DNA polymerase-3 subunit delta'|tara:strand:- start:544 stop:1491 length:948 start_codon:yes stop_codon:yes gene_type:complete
MNLLELKSNNQKQLFSFENIFLDIINLYDKKKLPNKILFSGPKGTGKATLAYHLSNYVFSKKEEFPYDVNKFKINDLNKSYKLILNNSHPNFHLIDVLTDKKIIEISQIRQMINYANKSAFNNGERIVLIDNAENLNLNSLNALLKIVEEPNENIIFIIIFDNNKKILNTLKSRCLKFNLFLTFDQSIETVNTIIEKNVYDLISKDLINHYNTTGDFINLINFSLLSKIDLSEINLKNFLINLIDEKHYKKDGFIKNNIYKYVEFYLLNLMKLKTSRNKISYLYKNFINKIYDLKKFNLDEESFFIEFKAKVLDE